MVFTQLARSSLQLAAKLQTNHIAQISLTQSFVRNFADKMSLPRVFFDMAADGNSVGRIIIEVSLNYAQVTVKKLPT